MLSLMANGEVSLFVNCTAKTGSVCVSIKVKFRETPGGLCHVVETEVRFGSVKVAYCVAAR